MRTSSSKRLWISWMVIVAGLALAGPGFADSGGERQPVGARGGAVEIGGHPGQVAGFIGQEVEIARLRELVAALDGRIAQLEARMNTRAEVATPPAPQVRCAGAEGCWVDWMGR